MSKISKQKRYKKSSRFFFTVYRVHSAAVDKGFATIKEYLSTVKNQQN
jgi:hypothetical protein